MIPHLKETTQKSSEDNQATPEQSNSCTGNRTTLHRKSESDDRNDGLPTDDEKFKRRRSNTVADDSDLDIEYIGTWKPGDIRNKIISTRITSDNPISESESHQSSTSREKLPIKVEDIESLSQSMKDRKLEIKQLKMKLEDIERKKPIHDLLREYDALESQKKELLQKVTEKMEAQRKK